MRLRLFLTFTLVIGVTILFAAIFLRFSAAQEVRTFIFRGGVYGVQELVVSLENYYRNTNSWIGVESQFPSKGWGSDQGQGKGLGRGGGGSGAGGDLLLYNYDGNVVYDPHGSDPDGMLSTNEAETAIPLEVEGRTIGYLVPPNVTVFDPDASTNLLKGLNKALMNAAVIAAVLSLALALWLSRRLMRPVQELTIAAGKMSQGDLSQRVMVQGGAELEALGKSFNQMASSLQNLQEQRQVMTADIAHELRTPLAIQQANIEAMLDGVYPMTAENLTPVLEQNQLLSRLVSDLRTLALVDSGELMLNFQTVELNQLVTSVAERFAPRAKQGRVSIVTELAPSIQSVQADPGRLEQILFNLLDNALRHTPENGVINIATRYSAGWAEVAVQDSGPGIAGDAMPHIFERFYRADRSRSRDEGGVGLGLAIARKLAEAHSGTLDAMNHPEGGALFQLRLPSKDNPTSNL